MDYLQVMEGLKYSIFSHVRKSSGREDTGNRNDSSEIRERLMTITNHQEYRHYDADEQTDTRDGDNYLRPIKCVIL